MTLITLCSGCINFYVRDKNFPEIKEWPFEIKIPKIIGLNISGKFHRIPQNPTLKSFWWTNEYIENKKDLLIGGLSIALHAFEESNLFKETQLGSNNSNHVANIHITWSEKRAFYWGLPHAVTLGILPVKNTRSVKVQMSILDDKGKILGEYEKSNRISAWRGLLLLPFSPLWIWWDDRSAEHALFEIFRQLIVDAHAQSVF